MDDILDIAEVVRRTGLTSRTLRFYEARGLLEPLRTDRGRRLYGAGALERINQIVTLKRAGLTIARIAELLAAGRSPDLARLVDAQLAALAVRQRELGEAMQLLIAVGLRIERGEAPDLATLCAMIRQSEAGPPSGAWQREMVRRLIGEDRVRSGVERMWAVLSHIDPIEHRRRAADLYARIERALPLDPDSAEAQRFYEEFEALNAPLKAVGSDEPAAPAEPVPLDEALERIEAWTREAQPPFSPKAFELLFTIGRDRGRR